MEKTIDVKSIVGLEIVEIDVALNSAELLLSDGSVFRITADTVGMDASTIHLVFEWEI